MKVDSKAQHCPSLTIVTLQHRKAQGTYRLTCDTIFDTGYLDSEICVPEAKATFESMKARQAKITQAGKDAIVRLAYITACQSHRHKN